MTEEQGAHYHTNGKDTVEELYEKSKEAGHWFCFGSIMKYVKRFGLKGNTNEEREKIKEKDLYKIANYAIIMLNHEYDKNYIICESNND